MAALTTVQDYVTSARNLLQDTVPDYRYPDADLLDALNMAFLEARRMRPDLFLGRFDTVPSYSTIDTTVVDIDLQYRTPFLYFIVGQVQLRDDEDTQDSRAAAFMNSFTTRMTQSAA